MDLLLLLAASLATGLLVKLTDSQTDEKIYWFKRAQYVTGIAYGVFGGLLLSLDARFSAVFLGVLVGVVVAGKIDRRAHQYAIAALLLTVYFLGFPTGRLFFLALVFALASAADEFVNDWADKRKTSGRLNAATAFVAEHRVLLELACLAATLATGDVAYFGAILAFDAGYLAVHYALKDREPAIGSLGTHLALDLFDCRVSKLEDEERVNAFLVQTTRQLGMRAIGKPTVARVKTGRDEGITGIMPIAESHISVHTFPRIQSCNVDIFSCKDFDVEKAKAAAAKWFGARVVRSHVLQRGERF